MAETATQKAVHVAVGVLTNHTGEILIARRAPQAHQGGLWEFPGGKVEPGETVQEALARELLEELGVYTADYTPVIQVAHDYGDKAVLLDVYRARIVHGQPHGREGQPLSWVAPRDLRNYPFPAANRPIVRALTLPQKMLITGSFSDLSDFERRLVSALQSGLQLIQLRAPKREHKHFHEIVTLARENVNPSSVRLVINRQHWHGNADMGLHLSSRELMETSQRPDTRGQLLGASCHNAEEILRANYLDVDYICLSPVKETATHPEATPLGWDNFGELTRLAAAPVYALGGMRELDIATAIRHGGQGIAGISAWW